MGNAKHATAIDALIAERIRAYRKQHRISQSALADKLGVTFQQVQKYEKGVNRIGAGRLYELARIFNVPIQSLFPEDSDTDGNKASRSNDVANVSKFALSADGWRLCQAFLSITDAETRKTIIALVQEITRR
jgi:transcriptional regulator with XRE-family HTH domain